MEELQETTVSTETQEGIKVEDAPPPPVETESQIFTIVEEMPSFPGGEAELYKFLAKVQEYPQMAVDAGIQGTVFVTFVVDKDGKVKDPKVLRGLGRRPGRGRDPHGEEDAALGTGKTARRAGTGAVQPAHPLHAEIVRPTLAGPHVATFGFRPHYVDGLHGLGISPACSRTRWTGSFRNTGTPSAGSYWGMGLSGR